jgi:hypothetical protein
VRPAPFQRTAEFVTKPVPFTVSVKPALPAVRDEGLMLVVVGTGLLGAVIVNVCALEVPPPGVGLYTVTVAVPVVAISEAKIAAVNWPEETNVVVRFAPFQRTREPVTKPVPFRVSVKPAPPAVPDDGLRLVVAGTGLLMLIVCALEVPPPGVGLYTVTVAVPVVAISEVNIAAVNRVEDT